MELLSYKEYLNKSRSEKSFCHKSVSKNSDEDDTQEENPKSIQEEPCNLGKKRKLSTNISDSEEEVEIDLGEEGLNQNNSEIDNSNSENEVVEQSNQIDLTSHDENKNKIDDYQEKLKKQNKDTSQHKSRSEQNDEDKEQEEENEEEQNEEEQNEDDQNDEEQNEEEQNDEEQNEERYTSSPQFKKENANMDEIEEDFDEIEEDPLDFNELPGIKKAIKEDKLKKEKSEHDIKEEEYANPSDSLISFSTTLINISDIHYYQMIDQAIKENTNNDIWNDVFKKGSTTSQGKGFAMFMDKNDWTHQSHVPFAENLVYRKVWKDIIEDVLHKAFGEEIEHLTIGHEHGKETNQCYFQIYIKLRKPAYFQFRPICFKVTVRNKKQAREFQENETEENKYEMRKLLNTKFIMICQKARSPTVQKVYERRNKDFIVRGGGRSPSKFLKPNCYKFSLANSKKTLPPLKWNFDQKVFEKFEQIKKWYQYNFNNEEQVRYKGLVLYGKRGTGKTYWAKHLVNSTGYCQYFNGSFCKNDIYEDQSQVKLLILDNFDMIRSMKEYIMWKSLIVGEQTTLICQNETITVNWQCPCIIITNNIKFVKFLYCNEELRDWLCFCKVDEWMGDENLKDTFYQTDELTIEKEKRQILSILTENDREFYNVDNYFSNK